MKSSTIEYFASLDIILLNIFGLSETTGPTTVSYLTKFDLKKAGSALWGTDLSVANPDENGVGEIITRGRHIMMGYLKNEEATKEVIDTNGFFHSGDLGKIDENGFLSITGRIKELIITAGGENVAPVLIEEAFKQLCPIINNIMVVGENQRFMGAILTFKVDIDPVSGIPSKNLTTECKNNFKSILDMEVKSVDDVIQNEKVHKYI